LSDLKAVLAAEIEARGPLSIARFMALALGHPTLGYYRRDDPLGAAGDFVTAPEISQTFGEIIGMWLAQAWSDLGAPSAVRLVELGPGRGTLLADLLRATARVPGFQAALALHLVETSPALRRRQAERLSRQEAVWHERFEEVPRGPLLLVANEFFDALPVHQLVRTADGWRERAVGLGRARALVLQEAPSSLPAPTDGGCAPGTIAEVSPARAALAREIGARIAGDGGVALLIDYGAWAEGPTGDTLQAMRGHAACDPLAQPGEADLSAQVDFRALAEAAAAAGAAVYGPVPQGTFLRALGIEARMLRLLAGASAERRRALRAALFRLTDASAMGELFKVLVLARPGAPLPPGFHAPTLLPGQSRA
jgi:NADH dehydrogenase [ubiquinone] 1 alpha subcomplex assembly factor 7